MNPVAFNNRYIKLGQGFSVETRPEPVKNPQLIKFNDAFAEELGLADTCLNATENLADGITVFAGNRIPEGAEPIAMAYAGHQFGHFNSQLGDGRAILLGEIDTPSGMHVDMQLKGSGRTYFSPA